MFGLALGAVNAHAETGSAPLSEERVAALSSEEIDEAFWECDHAATTVGMDATPVSFCSAIYDELKARKFGGDFERLLEWWRRKKPVEHARRSADAERVPGAPQIVERAPTGIFQCSPGGDDEPPMP